MHISEHHRILFIGIFKSTWYIKEPGDEVNIIVWVFLEIEMEVSVQEIYFGSSQD